ncbi:MAG TPA: integrase arm-type DNA-binding domain-containing protein, partial [Xanthobacteraceae bacterium]|nr:integrase arm-type DNA-binding domain-containing protein [Xanthobacteraceae bacterium]
MRLTAKGVEMARPADVRREIADAYMRGLYLIIQPTGSKSWAVRCRLGGKPIKHTIGSYPAFGLKEARDAAARVLRGVSEGRGPTSARVETVAQGVEQFLARHCKNYRPTTLYAARYWLRHYVVGAWGGRRLDGITRADIRALLASVEGPVAANRVHSIVTTFFRWCVGNDLLSSSPAAELAAPNKETPQERVLTDAELRRVWQATEEIGFPYGSILQLLILTGQRRGEVAGVTWSELDLEAGTWTLPRERVKNNRRHEVPLARQALAILRQVPRIGEVYVFTLNGTTPYSGFK